MALQEVADLAICSSSSSNKHKISLSNLRSILNTYGPNIHINQRSSIGGTFLVDVLRARHVKESTVLACVKELVDVYNASLYTPVLASKRGLSSRNNINSTRTGGGKGSMNNTTLPPLVIAAARGMPTIVKYILSKAELKNDCNNEILNVSSTMLSSSSLSKDYNILTQGQQQQEQHITQIKGTSRFRLFSNPKKSIHGTFTPLEFSMKMKQAEIENGAHERDLKCLNKCIELLSLLSQI
jgi:hypothetical protein